MIDIKKINDYSFNLGIGGIICYISVRLHTNKLEVSSFSDKFLYNLKIKILNSIEKIDDIHTLFNIFKYLEMCKYSYDSSQTKINITDCLFYPQTMPQNRQYWKKGLYEGCSGYTLQYIILQQQIKRTDI